MAPARVSVVVVSRERPAALTRCLTGLDQQFYPEFEIVVVADAAGIEAARGLRLDGVRLVPFEPANISAARNAGIARAGGDVIAFIDDDAVPEPTWLSHLSAAFEDPAVAAAGGFVIGRNGISFQWRAREVDAAGQARDLPLWGNGARVFDPPPDGAIKTEGTNMAVRRHVLYALGGFDEALAFYLDETDLNLRIARAGHRTALVPLAQVHHGFAASSRRRTDRAPLTLFDIGASSAVFWTKHLPASGHEAARRVLVRDQERRLLRHLVEGTAEPRDLRHLMRTLREGLDAGAARRPAQYPVPSDPPPFCPVSTPRPKGAVFLADRGAERQADAAREAGLIVTRLRLSRTTLYHRCRFCADGTWLQTGGLWGRSARDEPLVSFAGRAARVARERARIAVVRSLSGFVNPV